VRRYYADPQHCFSQTAQAPKTIASQAKEAGITMTPWPRTAGNEESMVERVRERLRQGKLKVFTTCTNTIAEFQTWSYKRNPKGERLGGEDQFEDKNNDAMDCICGAVALNLRPDPCGTRVYGV
jgi:phage terminase large subunit